MKITEIYISAFGGLKDFTISLSDGLNVIFGENENGKTTVMAFIKAMFYGTGKKTQTVSSSPRVKYAPFDGSQMGGRIYFEHGNKRFMLERIFNKSDATDKITLTDTDTGEAQNETNEIGARLFGMGAEAFEKSMFISSERSIGFDDTASGELNSRLSAVALTGDEDTSFSKVEKRITQAREKIISKSGRTGSYIKAIPKLEALKERYNKALEDAKRKQELNQKKDGLNESFGKLGKRYLAVKKLCDSKDDVKNAEKLSKYLELKAKLDILNEGLTRNGKIMDSNFVSKLKFCISKLDAQKEKINEINAEIERLEEENKLLENLNVEETKAKIEELKNEILDFEKEIRLKNDALDGVYKKLDVAEKEMKESENAKKSFSPVLFVLGIVFVLLGAVGGLIVNSLCYALSAIGIVLFVLCFIIKPNDKSRLATAKQEYAEAKEKTATLNNEIAVISQKSATKSSEMNMLTSALNADKTVKEKREGDKALQKQKLAEETEKSNALKLEYAPYFEGLDIENLDIAEIEEKANKQKDIKLELNIIAKDLGDISYEDAKKKLAEMSDTSKYDNIDFDAVEKEKESLSQTLSDIKQAVTAIETELKTSFRNSEQPEIVKREIDEWEEKSDKQKEFVDAADLAMEVLGESFANVRRSYGKALEEKTLNNFSYLTDGRYKSVGLTKSFDMTVEQNGVFGMHEIDYLSTGTCDQAMLSMRLAVCELIGENEPIPIMLDDALSNYDDKRTKTALEFLKNYSKNTQVLLFTCHNSVSNLSKEIGVEPKNLK